MRLIKVAYYSVCQTQYHIVWVNTLQTKNPCKRVLQNIGKRNFKKRRVKERLEEKGVAIVGVDGGYVSGKPPAFAIEKRFIFKESK